MKEFLRQQGIVYTEKDISKDDAAFNELTDKGFYATPVTMIDGDAVVGFNKPRLEQLLGS